MAAGSISLFWGEPVLGRGRLGAAKLQEKEEIGMTPEEKKGRLADLLEKVDAVERMFKIYNDSLPLGMNSINQLDYEYSGFYFEKTQVVRGENFTFLAHRKSSIRWPDAKEKLVYFGVSNTGNPLKNAISVVSVEDFLEGRSDSEYFELTEEAVFEASIAVQERYDECLSSLSVTAKELVQRSVSRIREFQKKVGMLTEERKRRIYAESRLFDLQNDTRTAIQDLATTRTFIRSGAIGKIREDLELAVDESQIDKKHPPRSDRPNPVR